MDPGSLSGSDRQLLHEAVDGSDFSLADWHRALGVFCDWLEVRGETRRPWAGMIGYLECCAHLGGPGLGSPDLSALLLRALEDHGFSILAELQD